MKALALVVLSGMLSGAAECREIIDATGSRVGVVDSPRRIVTLAPSLGELVADFLGTDLSPIVGVSEYTDYPPALSQKPQIGSFARFNLEKVVSLKPDLVLGITDGNPKDQVLHLKELGVPVVTVASSSISQVADSMKIVGEALGKKEAGERMASQFEHGIARFKARAPNRKPLRLLIQIGDRPLVAAGGKTFLDEVTGLLGARNVFSDSKLSYPKPSLEEVIKRDPDCIVVLRMGTIAESERMAHRWRAFPKLKAVRSRCVRVLDTDAIMRPSLRLLEGIGRLERLLFRREKGV